jgi:hypothetical protein
MPRILSMIACLALVIALFAGVASAQTSQLPVTPQPLPPAPPAPTLYLGPPVQHPTGGQFPWVASLKPFSPETNGMSLAGYLRQLVYWQTGKWLTINDAVRVVQQQQAS